VSDCPLACSVGVIAEIEDDKDIKIDNADLKIDTCRSSGKGGQYLNNTESAMRMAHMEFLSLSHARTKVSDIKIRNLPGKTWDPA
jgi:protein subunit release factor A